jgi:hypothetical protein
VQVETWKPVPGYEGYYEVSDRGRVRSVPRIIAVSGYLRQLKGRVLKPGIATGYYFVRLSRDGVSKCARVHRLVLAAFVGPCPAGMETLHGAKGRYTNTLSNLKYGTRLENAKDRKRDQADGSCIVRRSDGAIFPSMLEAARQCRVDQGNISRACSNKRRHVGGYKWELVGDQHE